MLLFQGCFLLEVCVTKQCPPPIADNAGIISSVSPMRFLSHSFCQRVYFKLPKASSDIFSRELPSEWLWSVSLRAFAAQSSGKGDCDLECSLLMCACVCSLHPISVMTCEHVGGARPHQVCRRKEQHTICVAKAKMVVNTLFHGCLSRGEIGRVDRK